jgi:PAS domain S-box-containing protein
MKSETILLLIITLINLTLFLLAARKAGVRGAPSIMVLSISLVIWPVASILYEYMPALFLNGPFIAIALLSASAAASAQLTYILSYTARRNWHVRTTLITLAILPFLSQISFWGNPSREVFSTGEASTLSLFLSSSASPWARLNSFYLYSLLGVGVVILLQSQLRGHRQFTVQFSSILAGALATLLVQSANLVGLHASYAVEPLLLGFTLSTLANILELYNRPLIEIIPVTRDMVIEDMADGWIVLNMENMIVDINPAAEAIIGLSREKVFGQPISSILTDLPNVSKAFNGNQELEMKRSIRSQEGWRYLNIRISTLADQDERQFGRLIVWRDITDRKLAEDARQRARDEMFVLLNAISSAATNTINLDDFLSESILHIVYPFRSQIVGIFLINERNNLEEDPSVFLASHFGFSPDLIKDMTYLTTSSHLFDWVMNNRQCLLIDDLRKDPRIPNALRESGYACLLVIPLVTQAGEDSKFVGFVCLARKELPIFGQDEIVRLMMISDQIATLIDSDRRRKLAISLSERQRLVRDLHDSVSQKLYGLVTLTEAAQAALEAGSTVNPSQVLSRIGENARQAVKEMRLFLYQMQPIDLEKDGLVSVLHHRLAAVEGRADIKARLLADEEIALSKDKEVALYFIAQEALNNVLRHAHAKSVSVTIKQGSRNVILEIVDDGRGFDPKKLDRAGLGLRNMRERALQIDGKIKIVSKPDQGTNIVIRVRKDQSLKSKKPRKVT